MVASKSSKDMEDLVATISSASAPTYQRSMPGRSVAAW